MSILFIMTGCTALAGFCETLQAALSRPRVKVYRKPDPPHRRKKSPSRCNVTGRR